MGLLDFIIHVFVDSTHATKGFDTLSAKAGAASDHIGKKLAATFSVAAVAAFIEHTAMAALETKKLAEQLGTTEEMVMKLQKLAAIKHIDPESLFGALGRTETFMRAAVGGEEVSEELAEKGYAEVGLSRW